MRTWIKYLIYGILGSLLLCILLIHLTSSLLSYSDKDVSILLPSADIQYINSTRTVYLDNVSDTLLVFVHGAPGDFSAFKDYLTDNDFNSYNLLAYDRPGYGYSESYPMVSIVEQSKVLLNIIQQYARKTIILIGHSYGCAIVGYLLAKESDLISKTIMIAPLIDPQNEPIFWFSYFAKWPITKWLLTNDLRSSGAEKFSHADALIDIEQSWKQIQNPILHIHGGKDGLAPPSANMDFSRRMIPYRYLEQSYYPDEGHLILWEQFELVKRDILVFIKRKS